MQGVSIRHRKPHLVNHTCPVKLLGRLELACGPVDPAQTAKSRPGTVVVEDLRHLTSHLLAHAELHAGHENLPARVWRIASEMGKAGAPSAQQVARRTCPVASAHFLGVNLRSSQRAQRRMVYLTWAAIVSLSGVLAATKKKLPLSDRPICHIL